MVAFAMTGVAVAIIEFLFLPIVTGLLLSVAAGPLGSLMVWRRMAFFGDTVAHSALLGVALSLLANVESTIMVLAVALMIALLLWVAEYKSLAATDTLLGILSHSSLAIGMIVFSLSPSQQISLTGLLFGDILLIGTTQVGWVALIVLSAALLIIWRWKQLVLMTLSEDLAAAEGVGIKRHRWLISSLIALTVAIAIPVVGILLITALLIIPAATARYWASTPVHMAITASMICGLGLIIGLIGALLLDLPSGPSIVVTLSLTYALTRLFRKGD